MIYAIGDLHFDYSKDKPMDIFGDNWINHDENIINNWKRLVSEDDLVILPGDITWALKLNEANEDLMRINELPGQKVILKGNHDYWWGSLSKLNSLGLDTIYFIQNNSFVYDNVGIVGTRGWIAKDSDDFSSDDERIYNRELNRLKLSLQSLPEVDKRIAILHYPPFNIDLTTNEFVSLMKEFDVDICLYGHLHSEGHKYAVEGNIDGIEFHCVSSDFINFIPKLIL